MEKISTESYMEKIIAVIKRVGKKTPSHNISGDPRKTTDIKVDLSLHYDMLRLQ